MPRIPTYTAQVSPPAPQVAGLMDPGVAAAPYRELAKIGPVIADFAAKMLQARRVTDLSNARTGALKEVMDFETSLAGRQDFENFEREYNDKIEDIKVRAREELTDNVVYRAFETDFADLAIRKSSAVRGLADRKRIQFGRASFFNNMTTRLGMLADADELTRTNILDQARIDTAAAVAVGYLNAEEGARGLHAFLEQADIIEAMEDIRDDPGAFDPKDYPHIDPKALIRFADDAVRRLDSNRKESIRLEKKAETAREKALKKKQEQAAREMWVRIPMPGRESVETDLTLPEVDEGILNGTLSLSEGKALQSALKSERTESDPEDLLELNEDVRDGSPGIKDRILNVETIAPGHKNALLQKLYSLQDEKKKHDYTRAANTIKAFIITEYGPLGQFVKADEIQDYNFAINELDLRLGKGEGIWQATGAILGDSGNMKPRVPVLKYGSIENIEEAERLLVEAYMRQQIDEKASKLETGKIEAYKKSLEVYNNRVNILQQLSQQR